VIETLRARSGGAHRSRWAQAHQWGCTPPVPSSRVVPLDGGAELSWCGCKRLRIQGGMERRRTGGQELR